MKQIRGWEKPLKLKKGDAAIARKGGGVSSSDDESSLWCFPLLSFSPAPAED